MNLRRIAAFLALAAVVGVFSTGSAQADLATIHREARQGDAQAQLHLGILYEFGYHMAGHDIKAVVWYTLAAERGSIEAARRRDLLAAHLSPAENREVAHDVALLDAKMPHAPASVAPARQSGAAGSSDAGSTAPAATQPR